MIIGVMLTLQSNVNFVRRKMAARRGRGRCAVAAASALATLIAAPGLALAQAAAMCGPPPLPISVNLITDDGPLHYDHNQTRDELGVLAKSQGAHSHGLYQEPMGLTSTRSSIQLRTLSQPIEVAPRVYCLWFTRVDVKVGYSTTVYVDKTYREPTCEYDAILKHEHEHVAINRDVLNEYGPRLRLALEASVAALNPIVVRDLRESRDSHAALLQQRLRPALDAFDHERSRANAIIDTTENYARVMKQCRDW